MTYHYQLYGMQRTGTNFFQTCLELNENAIMDNYGIGPPVGQSRRGFSDPPPPLWKHYLEPTPEALTSERLFLTIKHPYTWVESITTRLAADILVHKKYDLKQIASEKDMIGKCNVPNLVRTYNDFYMNWLSVNPEVVIYEDLLDPENDKYGNWIKPERVHMSKNWSSDRIDYYREMKPKILTEHHIRIIDDLIDDSIWNLYND